MNRTAYNLIATSLTTFALATALPAQAASADAAFSQVSQTYRAASEPRWVNALAPQASVDYIAATEGISGKAAYGTPTDSSAWSGHADYDRAFVGTPSNKPGSDAMGKAAYGTSSSDIDGLAAYRNAFHAD